MSTNAPDAIGNGKACQAGATRERRAPNACDTTISGNNAIITTTDQRFS